MSIKNESVLKLRDLYIDEMNFIRQGNPEGSNPTLQYSRELAMNGNHTHRVSLGVLGKYPNGTSFEIRLVGIFGIDLSEDIDEKKKGVLLRNNAVAIMFPYLRSQVTLLTTQPGMSALYLPLVNIVALFEDAKNQI